MSNYSVSPTSLLVSAPWLSIVFNSIYNSRHANSWYKVLHLLWIGMSCCETVARAYA